MNDGYRHSMCRACWRKYHHRRRSIGHETEKARRVIETCCFCLAQHHSGIQVAKNPADRKLKCANTHMSIELVKAKAERP